MKQLDNYFDLCTQVYDIKHTTPPVEEYAFYRSYAQEAHGPILEPMCGTGRFLLPLFKEKFDIVGFDASHSMLHALQLKTSKAHLSPLVWYDFVEQFTIAKQYNLIFIPSGSFNLIVDTAIVLQALQNMYRHLKPGGLLVIESMTTYWQGPEEGVWHHSKWHKKDGSYIVHSQLELPRNDNLLHSTTKYELIKDNTVVKTEMEDYNVRLYTNKQFTELLNIAGFADIQYIKAFNRNQPADEHDELVIYECKK